MLTFAKFEGCANDFLVTESIAEGAIATIVPQAARICDRRRGVGGDGIIFILPSTVADYKMRILNADGSEPEMCGNGVRCCAVFLRDHQRINPDKLTIETLAGIKTVEFVNDQVKVNMGNPILSARKIPTAKNSDAPLCMEPLSVENCTFAITTVSMGNPHAVIYADELNDDLVLGCGPQIETHPFFPRKTNVEFIRVRSNTEIDMRVWERGCGETMACGTGACASVVAGILNKKHSNAITVHLLGGDLFIEWDGNENHPVFMTGPAHHVFNGSINL